MLQHGPQPRAGASLRRDTPPGCARRAPHHGAALVTRRPRTSKATHVHERDLARVRDLKDLLAQLQRTEARVAETVVTVLHHAEPRTLAAFGVVL